MAEVIQAHEEKRTRHALRSVIEHWTLTTHNDSVAYWRGEHGARVVEHPRRIRDAIEVYRGNDGYIDVHAWYFTPTNFWNITSALHAAGHNALEFLAVRERV